VVRGQRCCLTLTKVVAVAAVAAGFLFLVYRDCQWGLGGGVYLYGTDRFRDGGFAPVVVLKVLYCTGARTELGRTGEGLIYYRG